MTADRRDVLLAASGVILIVIAAATFSTEVGKGLGFIGLMLVALAALSQLAKRGTSGPPTSGGPGHGPHL